MAIASAVHFAVILATNHFIEQYDAFRETVSKWTDSDYKKLKKGGV